MTMRETSVPCLLCGRQASLLKPDHLGYARPSAFAIFECATCDTQFAEPRTADHGVYNLIYENAGTLPGYSRYAWYADKVESHRDPLAWLATQQEMYWFVWKQLESMDRTQEIIELGSGLGYLTYSLHRADYRVQGLDISRSAVEAARARFGDLYTVLDVESLGVAGVNASVPSADVIIMTEVLEHVADPVQMVASIARMLRPGGTALITTPNKSSEPQGAYWLTDNPPVHFWWLSETSMRRIAERCGLLIGFADFTEWNIGSRPRPSSDPMQAFPPYFDDSGHQVHPSAPVREALRIAPRLVLGLAAALRRRHFRRAHRILAAQRSPTMGIILRRPW